MKRKVLSILVALCLTITMAVPVAAASINTAGVAGSTNNAVNPAVNDAENTNGKVNPSTGALNNAGADADITGGELKLDVQAKINEEDANIIYNIDIAWGTLKFVYNRSSQVWNPVTHKYADGPTAGSWLADNGSIIGAAATEFYLDGTNNKITVTNHSNAGVDATFTYANNGPNLFNAAAGANNVVGGFYDSNGGAIGGAGVLTNPAGNTAFNTLNGIGTPSLITLPTGVKRNPASNTEIKKDVFFAFSGTPDSDKTIAAFTNVGTITVVFVPNNSVAANTIGTDTY